MCVCLETLLVGGPAVVASSIIALRILSNYFELNSYRWPKQHAWQVPTRGQTGGLNYSVSVCSDIVINGDANWTNATHSLIVGLAGGSTDIQIEGNFHRGGACPEYSGVFISAGVGVSASGNKVISCGGHKNPTQRCAMVTTGTDRSNYNVSSVRVSNNLGWQHQLYALAPSVPTPRAAAMGLNSARFSSFRDDSVPQRPVYSMADGTSGWLPVKQGLPLLTVHTRERTLATLGEPTFEWPLAVRTPAGAIVAKIPLAPAASRVIGHGVWFGVRVLFGSNDQPVPKMANLTLLIDPGSGEWQVSTWVAAGHGRGWWDEAIEPFWRTYEMSTMLDFNGSARVARFAIIVSGVDAAVGVDDLMVAPIGVEWTAAHNTVSTLPLKMDDTNSSRLTLRRTINDHKGSAGHDGLQYVVQARSYVSSPKDLVTTMRGGGVAVWRWGDDNATVPSLAVRSFVMEGIPTEGQDSIGDLLVIVRLNHGITTLDWPSLHVRGSVNISVTGALHCKLWRDGASARVFALVTTGLTHVEADRDYLVAVEVTDRTQPREVAKLLTPVKDTEGVLVVNDFAYVGGYVENNRFVSVDLRGLVSPSTPAGERLKVNSVAGPRPEYDNMVGALANSSFRFPATGTSESPPPTLTMYYGSYARPGGLLIFKALENGSVLAGAMGSLLLPELSRTNRVHIHPTGDWALLALEKGFAGTDNPPVGETGGIAVVDIREPAAPTLVARAPSPIAGKCGSDMDPLCESVGFRPTLQE